MQNDLDDEYPNTHTQVKINITARILESFVVEMMMRSAIQDRISPRYRIAMYGYGEDVYDILDGTKTIRDVATLPELKTFTKADTALGFRAVKELLGAEIPKLPDFSPAPLVIHITDGNYTGENPQKIVTEIMNMQSVADGHVLVENIYLSNTVLFHPVRGVFDWEGITEDTELHEHGKMLKKMSSFLPTSYHMLLKSRGYKISEDSFLLFPGVYNDLVSFVMCGVDDDGIVLRERRLDNG